MIDKIKIILDPWLSFHLIGKQHHFGSRLLRDSIRERGIIEVVDQDQRNFLSFDLVRHLDDMLGSGRNAGSLFNGTDQLNAERPRKVRPDFVEFKCLHAPEWLCAFEPSARSCRQRRPADFRVFEKRMKLTAPSKAGQFFDSYELQQLLPEHCIIDALKEIILSRFVGGSTG